MANAIKKSGDGVALQITKAAREAELVEETDDPDGKTATYKATTRVHALDALLLVVDVDEVDAENEADLVATAARDTSSVYRTMEATVQIAGHGYQLQLPTARDAGFQEGDAPSVITAPGVLFLAGDHDRVSVDVRPIRVAEDLATIRRSNRGD
ncbi:hypothetical protein [Halobacterium salinarum]|uniref:hypothetical protein n=1 Tax=Halobacterium salinarum TaxID=2242 RepID=UPI0025552A82|nr:hypothetical protein [Halobacterium salinarum]MDL0123113.1 hypothetical protein [Halobacterium salinarum]MDL0131394.1 hypothetical protein [Halobacterium salinarum]